MLQVLPVCMALAERRYRRNRCIPFYRQLVRIGSAFPRLHPKGTSSRFALRAPRPRWGLAMTNLEAFAVLTIACTNRKRYAGSGCPLPYRVRAVVSPQSTRSNTIGYSEPNIPPQSPLSSSCGGVR